MKYEYEWQKEFCERDHRPVDQNDPYMLKVIECGLKYSSALLEAKNGTEADCFECRLGVSYFHAEFFLVHYAHFLEQKQKGLGQEFIKESLSRIGCGLEFLQWGEEYEKEKGWK